MIYIDFFIRATQERHFYKIEGDSFEITELHIGRNNYEWTGRERDETHSIPIRFTLKTNLGEYHNFDIDCGYTEGKDFIRGRTVFRSSLTLQQLVCLT